MNMFFFCWNNTLVYDHLFVAVRGYAEQIDHTIARDH